MSFRSLLVENVDSVAIAERLEAAGATCCEHQRNPCTIWCGVRCATVRLDDTHTMYDVDWKVTFITAHYLKTGPWIAVPWTERVRWAEDVDALSLDAAVRPMSVRAIHAYAVADGVRTGATCRLPIEGITSIYDYDHWPSHPPTRDRLWRNDALAAAVFESWITGIEQGLGRRLGYRVKVTLTGGGNGHFTAGVREPGA